jgi:hypothetical protein
LIAGIAVVVDAGNKAGTLRDGGSIEIAGAVVDVIVSDGWTS